MKQGSSAMTLDVSVKRFEPMLRLLSGEDEEYLLKQGFPREAAELRARHRKLFLRFVDMLEKDFTAVQTARQAAMAGSPDLEILLRDRMTATFFLLSIRYAALMHFLRLPGAGRYAEGQLRKILVPVPA